MIQQTWVLQLTNHLPELHPPVRCVFAGATASSPCKRINHHETYARPLCTGDTHRESPAHRSHGTPAGSGPARPAHALTRSADSRKLAQSKSADNARHSPGPSSRCEDSMRDRRSAIRVFRLMRQPQRPCAPIAAKTRQHNLWLARQRSCPDGIRSHRAQAFLRCRAEAVSAQAQSHLARAATGPTSVRPCRFESRAPGSRSTARALRKYARIQYAASMLQPALRAAHAYPRTPRHSSCATQSSTLSSRL